MKITANVQSIRFGQNGRNDNFSVVVDFKILINGITWNVGLYLTLDSNRMWSLKNLLSRSGKYLPSIIYNKSTLRLLLNQSYNLLSTINVWPFDQTDGAATIGANQNVIPKEFQDRTIVSFRPKILLVPSADWSFLWDLIEQRVASDPFFKVLGFDSSIVLRVLPILKELFPSDWVRARFNDVGLSKMSDELEQGCEGWFPAYHLSRTAHGIICRDPGWNYLTEIGLALETLKDFPGTQRLKRQLTKSPGTQHHLCIAAEFYNRGILKGLEPHTGSGSASNDILIEIDGVICQIEIKEFSSNNPSKRLKNAMKEKGKKLPSNLKHPTVFHVVLNENGQFDKLREDIFFDTVMSLKGELPRKISAVVAGKRFVDSRGGSVKRDIERILVNSDAILPVTEEYLRNVFLSNYQNAYFPLYGIGNFLTFSTK